MRRSGFIGKLWGWRVIISRLNLRVDSLIYREVSSLLYMTPSTSTKVTTTVDALHHPTPQDLHPS